MNDYRFHLKIKRRIKHGSINKLPQANEFNKYV